MSIIRNISTVGAITGTVSIDQHAVESAVNSSTTNLAKSPDSGYKFEGTAISTLGVNAIQVSLKTDQNCTVTVEQSPDNAPTSGAPHWDIVDTYNYYASINNFGITVQAVSSYVRVTVTNLSTTTATTYFRLQTVLCPMVEALPRSLDSNGHLKTSIKAIEDEYGFEVENTPTGEMRTVEPVRLVGTNFTGSTIDSNFWTTAASGTSAAIAQGNAQLLLTSGTSNAATVTAYTFRRARYVGGSSMRYRAVIQLGDTGTANNRRRWGVGYGTSLPTITDGAYFQLDGTEFSVNTIKSGGTPTKITSFNGVLGSSYAPGTSVTTYEIYWTNSAVYFVIGGKLLHTVSASSATWCDMMGLHIFMDSLNSGVLGASVTMAVRTATISRLGKLETAPTSKYLTGVNSSQILKYGAGRLHRIVVGTPVNSKTITVYDNVTGTTGTMVLLTLPSQSSPLSLEIGADFYNGLNVVPNDTGLAITVVYE